MDRRELENIENHDEQLDAESARVAALLGALPRAEAPANFEFGVKAGISNRVPTTRSGMLPFLKLAAPLGLVLLVGGLVLFFGSYPAATDGEVVVVPVSSSSTAPASLDPGEVLSKGDTNDVSSPRAMQETLQAASEQRKMGASTPRSNRYQPDVRRPIDFTQRSANVIMPPGTEAANPRNRNMNSGTGSDAQVNDLFQIWGITAEFADDRWKVGSVVENSVGARAGVQPNDVVDSINSQPLKKDTKIRTEAGVRTLQVTREGKQITLNLRN